MHFELSPVIVWIAFWIVNTYFESRVNIFCNNIDITKCQSFCVDADEDADGDDVKAIATPRVFSENRRANYSYRSFKSLQTTKLKASADDKFDGDTNI